jgi:hypothetical protein
VGDIQEENHRDSDSHFGAAAPFGVQLLHEPPKEFKAVAGRKLFDLNALNSLGASGVP